MKTRRADGISGSPYEQLVVCPGCGNDYVHPEEVRLYPVHGELEYRITAAGLSRLGSDAADRQRGISIVIRFWCEGCHRVWDSTLTFHKGNTFYQARHVKELGATESGGTIWRD